MNKDYNYYESYIERLHERYRKKVLQFRMICIVMILISFLLSVGIIITSLMLAESASQPTAASEEQQVIAPTDEVAPIIRTIHTVNEDDTLWDIAICYWGYGPDCVYIMAYNNLQSTDLDVGQELLIPTEEEKLEMDPSEYESFIEPVNYTDMIYYGECDITGYDPWCTHCAPNNGVTASTRVATPGYTVAMNGLPFGTEIYVEGYGKFVVEDRGLFDNFHVDIACESHEECYAVTGKARVYIIN